MRMWDGSGMDWGTSELKPQVKNKPKIKKKQNCPQYGGDVTRRMKLLKNQAEGKKKMRSIANINVPKDTFINVLKR